MQVYTSRTSEKLSSGDPLKTLKHDWSKPWTTAKYCPNLSYIPTDPTMWRRRGATWPWRVEIKPASCFLEAENGGHPFRIKSDTDI